MQEIKFYIDYDEDPAIGSQQGIFWVNKTKNCSFSKLIGCEIVSIDEDEESHLVFTVISAKCDQNKEVERILKKIRVDDKTVTKLPKSLPGLG